METADLSELEQKVSFLLSYRPGLIAEIRRVNERRRQVKLELRSVGEKIKAERTELDTCYANLRTYRESRNEVLSRLRKTKEDCRLMHRTLASLARVAPKESPADLSEKLDEIEWKLQTARLSRVEEKALMVSVKNLAGKTYVLRRAESAKKRLERLIAEIKGLSEKLDGLQRSRTEAIHALEFHRARSQKLLGEKDQLFLELDDLNADLEELKQGLEKCDEELSTFEARRRELAEKLRHTRESEIIARVKESVSNRLSKGARVSFDEFKLAFSDEKSELLK